MKWRNIRDIVAACLLAASLLLACLSSFGSYPAHRSEVVARKMERTVNRRMARLDRFVAKALQQPQDEWLELKGLPDDMVIHRMTGDGPRKLLIAPLWTTDKKKVLNTLRRKLADGNGKKRN